MGRSKFILIVCNALLVITSYAQTPLHQEHSGVLDASNWKFEKDRLPLKGYWVMFENELVNPELCKTTKGTYSLFPELWSKNTKQQDTGVATYYLAVLVPDSISTYSLEIPQLYNSYNLYVNEKLVASAGKVGLTKQETIPQWISQKVSFRVAPNDTLNIVIQLANFHHSKGGARDVIYLGIPGPINNHYAWAFGSNVVEIVFLLLEGLVFLIVFMKYREKVVLYFSLLCLTWAIRATFSNIYPLVNYFPSFDWQTLVKIEYLSLYGAVIWAALFLCTLFKNVSKKVITYLLVTINVFFCVFTVFTPPIIFTRWVSVYLTVAFITILYCAFLIIRALLREQSGAWFLTGSLLLSVVVFGYDIVSYGSAAGYNHVLLHIGYMLIFMMVTGALLVHLGILKTSLEGDKVLTYNELFKKDEIKR